MHVTIDGFGGDRDKLADEDLVRALLDRYPAEIGMTKIAPPYVCRYQAGKPEDSGVSGFVLIAESHISVHTFPERGYLWVDIFSCKGFEAERAIRSVKADFGLADVRTFVLPRGLEYPHNVGEALPLAQREREDLADAIDGQGALSASRR